MATTFEARSTLWAAMETYRHEPTAEHEQAAHKAMDDYEQALQAARPASDVPEKLGDVMTEIEDGVAFKDFGHVKTGLEMLTKLQHEIYTSGV